MNLHDKIISEIIKNSSNLEVELKLYNCKTKSNLSLGKYGDIDIHIIGFDLLTKLEKEVIIEVKSHDGLIPHYKKIQLPKYLERYPNADQYLVYSKSGKSNFDDLEFIRF